MFAFIFLFFSLSFSAEEYPVINEIYQNRDNSGEGSRERMESMEIYLGKMGMTFNQLSHALRQRDHSQGEEFSQLEERLNNFEERLQRLETSMAELLSSGEEMAE